MFNKKEEPKTKWRHPEAPDENATEPIWDDLLEIEKVFHNDRHPDWKKWEKEENLEGLLSDLNEKNVRQAYLLIKGVQDHIPPHYMAEILTTLVCGIRYGVALERKRTGKDW